MTYWAVSDMHGYYNFYEKIKKAISPEDKVICLGDCGDRGPQSWKLIKAVLNDPQFILLKGNHEDMLVKALNEYFEDDRDFPYSYYVTLCWRNGGRATFYDATNDNDIKSIIKILDKLPIEYHYTNPNGKRIILCHAGFTPGLDNTNLKDKNYIWDRTHISDNYFDNSDYDIVIHGHTPIPYNFIDKSEFIGKPHFYCNDHKICIDSGTFITKKGMILNLDTLESISFDL